MRDLKRNQTPFWYSLYTGKEAVLVNGLKTGQTKETYTAPVQAMAHISPAAGGSEAEMFGNAVQYDRVISTVQNLPIDEYSRVWVDSEPNEKADNFDYKVKKAARGLNHHLWAIEKVIRNGK